MPKAAHSLTIGAGSVTDKRLSKRASRPSFHRIATLLGDAQRVTAFLQTFLTCRRPCKLRGAEPVRRLLFDTRPARRPLDLRSDVRLKRLTVAIGVQRQRQTQFQARSALPEDCVRCVRALPADCAVRLPGPQRKADPTSRWAGPEVYARKARWRLCHERTRRNPSVALRVSGSPLAYRQKFDIERHRVSGPPTASQPENSAIDVDGRRSRASADAAERCVSSYGRHQVAGAGGGRNTRVVRSCFIRLLDAGQA